MGLELEPGSDFTALAHIHASQAGHCYSAVYKQPESRIHTFYSSWLSSRIIIKRSKEKKKNECQKGLLLGTALSREAASFTALGYLHI